MKSDACAVRDGRKLAIDMLNEWIDKGDADLCSIERRWHPGAPQRNITFPFVQEICRRPELAEGFAALLTDYLTLSEGLITKSYYINVERRLRRAEKTVEASRG
jgi:hypothetical protein